MFWRPDRSGDVLPLIAAPAAEGRPGLGLNGLRCRLTLLAMPDRTVHVLFSDTGRRLQLAVRGLSAGVPIRLLADACIDLGRLERRLLLLRRLSTLLQLRCLAPRLHPAERKAGRLRLVLQALDGALAGASHREIAIALFGARRVDDDWRDPGAHLPDRVRRAVRRGRFLMRRGYLQLLK